MQRRVASIWGEPLVSDMFGDNNVGRICQNGANDQI